MDLSIIISAVIALAAGLMVGWLATKARADQIRADLIEERRELDIELSAARQQLAQEAHWREECELLNNELRSLRDINTSLEADLREVTTRLESTQLHAEDKIRLAQMGVKEGIDEKIAAVAKATCAEGETIHNMPFAVTPESVHAAILTADLLGQQWLAR